MSYEQLLAALMAYFGDKSRTAAETFDGLTALIDEAEMLRESL